MPGPLDDALLGSSPADFRAAYRQAVARGDTKEAARLFDLAGESRFRSAVEHAPTADEAARQRQVTPEAASIIEGSYERRGKPEGLSLGQYVEIQADAMERAGKGGKARLLRDYLAQRQAKDLPATAAASGRALQEAAVEAAQPSTRIGFGRRAPGFTGSPADALEVGAAEETAARAGLPAPTFQTATGVSPERQKDLLDAAGMDTEGMTLGQIAQHFARQFGNQVTTNEAADAAAGTLWRQAARRTADTQETGYLDFPTTDLARTYVKAQKATVHAADVQRASEDALLHKTLAASTAVLRNLSFGLYDRTEHLDPRVRQEHEAAVGMLAQASPWMLPAMEGGALIASAPVFGGVTNAWTKALGLARVPAAFAQVGAEGLTMGMFSALSARGSVGERAQAGLHGLGMGLLASPFSTLVRQGLQSLPGPLANAFSSGAGFLAAEYVLQGGNLEDGQALNTFLTGASMGLGHGETPEAQAESARTDAARAVFMDGLARAGLLHNEPRTGRPIIDFTGTSLQVDREGVAHTTDLAGVRSPAPTVQPGEVPPAAPGAVQEARNASYAEALANPSEARGEPREPAPSVSKPKKGAPPANLPLAGPASGEPTHSPIGDTHTSDVRRWVTDLPEGAILTSPAGTFRVRHIEGGQAVEFQRPDGSWAILDRQGTFGGETEALKAYTINALARARTLGPEGPRTKGERATPPKMRPEPPRSEPGTPLLPERAGGEPPRRLLRTPRQNARHEPAVRARLEREARQRQRRLAGEKENRNLEDARFKDTRTGLRNQEAWEAMRSRWEKDASGEPVPPKGARFWTADLGNFKEANDVLGHEEGNVLLGKVGARIREAAQEVGLDPRDLFRTGGDEFAVTGASREQVDALHAAISKRPYVEHKGARVYIDGGVGDTPSAADAASSQAKAARKAAQGIGGRGSDSARRVLRTGKTEPAASTGAPRVSGRSVSIPTRKGKVHGEYALMESEHVIQSHDPSKGFDWNPAYQPQELQERDYKTRVREQGKVQGFAARFDPAEVANTAPRATDGPPTVTRSGIVLNGNGRVMVLKSLSPEQRASYRSYLEEHATEFGLTAEQVRGMKDPILVRSVDLDPTSKEAFDFARTGQEGTTQALRPLDYAARHVGMVSEGVWDALRTDAGESLGEAINAKGADFRKALHAALPESERGTYFKDDLTLTDAGKELAEGMVTIRAFSDPKDPASVRQAVEWLDSLPPQYRNTLAASAVQVFDLGRNPWGEPQVRGLMDASWYWAKVMGGEEPQAWLKSAETAQTPVPPVSPLARAWMDFIYTNRASPRKFRAALKALATLENVTNAEEQGLFKSQTEATDPLVRLVRVLDGWRPKDGEAVVVDDKGGLMFGTPGGPGSESMPDVPPLGSSERVSELPDGLAVHPTPFDLAESPTRQNGYALDLPPMTYGPTGDWKGKRVGPQAIIRALEKVTRGIPIRAGGMTPAERRRAAGYFKVGPEIIRLRQANDLPSAAHETAHALEKVLYWNILNDPNFFANMGQPFDAELARLGRMLYGSKVPAAGYVREGFAEFLRGWLFQVPDVSRHTPNILRWFEGTFLKQHPAFGKDLLALRDLTRQYVAQGARNMALSGIAGRSPGVNPGKIRRFLRRSRTRMIEAGDALASMTDAANLRLPAALSASADPFALLTGLRLTHTARARYMVEHGMIDVQGNLRPASALKDAVDMVTEHGTRKGWGKQQTRDNFTLYLWARRAIERIRREKGNPGMSLGTAKEIVRTLDSPEFQMAADRVYAWNRGLLEYAVSGGALSPNEAAAIMAGSTDYVPLARVVDSIADAGGAFRAVQGGTPLKRFRGSGERIRDPFQVMIENAEKMVRFTHERMVSNAVVALSRVEGMGRWIDEIPVDKVPNKVRMDQIRRQLEEGGADLTLADPDHIIEFFTPAQFPDRSKPIISHKDPATGKTRWYEVDPNVYEALHGLDMARLPKVLDWTLGRVARGLRLGTTGLRAAFSLGTNPVRDAATGWLQSTTRDNPLRYFGEWSRSLANEAARTFAGKDNPYSDLFARLGGSMAQPLGIDTRQTRRAAKELFSGKGWKGRAVRIVRSPIEHFRDFLQFPEAATRVAELRRVAEAAGYKPGGPISLDQSLAMLIAAKRVTVDFTAAGTWARSVNQVVPFFNASIQGARSFARAYRESPLRTTLVGLTRTALALGLWNLHKDEDWYRDMPWREKFSFFWIPVGDELVGIPRVYDWDNAFATLPEAIVDAMYREGPHEVLAALGHIVETSPLQYLTPQGALGANPLIGTGAEVLSNRDFYTGKSIVPENEQRLPKEEQAAPYSSGVARWLSEHGLGEYANLSPREIDHTLRGMLGSAPHDLLGGIDAVLGTHLGMGARAGEREFKDVPVIGQAFGRRGGKEGVGSRAVEDLFDSLAKARQTEASKKREEQPQERERRLALEDAAKAVKWLRVAQGGASTQAERQAIQREIRSLARRALAAPVGVRFSDEAKEAEYRGRAATSPPPPKRRILRPR